METASQTTTTQIQQKPGSILPEVSLYGYDKKRRPRIKDQNLKQEIARLGILITSVPPTYTPSSPTLIPVAPPPPPPLPPTLTLIFIVAKPLHISSNWVRYERGAVVSVFQQLLLPLCHINLFVSAVVSLI